MRKWILFVLLSMLAATGFAQIGTPGMSPPTQSPSFAGAVSAGTSITAGTTVTAGTLLKTGAGTCASTSANFGPLSGMVPSATFTSYTTDGLCYDTGADGNSAGLAFVHASRLYAKAVLNGGFTLFGSSVGGVGGGKVFSTSATGGTLYGPDSGNATPYTPVSVATWGYTTAGANNGIAFSINNDLNWQGTSNDGNLTKLTVTNPTAQRVITLPDYSGTVLISSTANEPDTANAFWVNTGQLKFEGSTANAFETTLAVTDPTASRTITFPNLSGNVLVTNGSGNEIGTVGVSAASRFTVHTSNVTAETFDADANIYSHMKTTPSAANLYSQTVSESSNLYVRSGGTLIEEFDPKVSRYIEGGYTIDGQSYIDPADNVKVTVVDTTPGIIDGDVQVCGYLTTSDATAQLHTCETLDFATGAGNKTTTNTFVEVTNIKSSSFNVLGGGGDETIAAEWVDGVPTSILAATNIVNHTAGSTYPTGLAPTKNLYFYKCLDLAGCTIDLSGGGVELVTFLFSSGTQTVNFADTATMKVSASHALNAYDTISFIYNDVDSMWLQTAVAAN